MPTPFVLFQPEDIVRLRESLVIPSAYTITPTNRLRVLTSSRHSLELQDMNTGLRYDFGYPENFELVPIIVAEPLPSYSLFSRDDNISVRHGYQYHSPTLPTPVRENTLPGGFTFGWELEACIAASDDNIPSSINIKEDASVNEDGKEYVLSESAVNDSNKGLNALEQLLDDEYINVDKSCAFHVHLGLPKRNRISKQWAGWMVVLGRLVEDKAFQAVPMSRRSNNYCRKLSLSTEPIQARFYPKEKYRNDSRYYWINVVEMFREEGIKTVEIRLLGNTKRWEYCLAWISVCHLMAQAALRLVKDPSRLAQEVEKLNNIFEQIGTGFLDGETDSLLAYQLAVSAKIKKEIPAYLLPKPFVPTFEQMAIRTIRLGIVRCTESNTIDAIASDARNNRNDTNYILSPEEIRSLTHQAYEHPTEVS